MDVNSEGGGGDGGGGEGDDGDDDGDLSGAEEDGEGKQFTNQCSNRPTSTAAIAYHLRNSNSENDFQSLLHHIHSTHKKNRTVSCWKERRSGTETAPWPSWPPS